MYGARLRVSHIAHPVLQEVTVSLCRSCLVAAWEQFGVFSAFGAEAASPGSVSSVQVMVWDLYLWFYIFLGPLDTISCRTIRHSSCSSASSQVLQHSAASHNCRV